jgi:DNA-binding MurR/RpiR family transcriptional regulator
MCPKRYPESTANGPGLLIDRLAPQRREIIRRILDEPRVFVLLSLRSSARHLNIDAATLLRIVRAIGFKRYHDFQQYLHDRSIAFSTALDSMEPRADRKNSVEAIVGASLDRDFDNVKQLRNNLDRSRVVAVAKKIHAARRILVMAGDMARSLAMYLDYNLGMLGLNTVVALSPGEIIHRARHVNSKDVAFAVSYGRGLHQTVEGLKAARENGAFCVAISDTFVSPLARIADQFFLTSAEHVSFADSYVAGMALLGALLTACANVHRQRTVSVLKKVAQEQRTGYRWHADGS